MEFDPFSQNLSEEICQGLNSRILWHRIDAALSSAAHLIQFLCLLPPACRPWKYLLLGGPAGARPSVASWLEFEGWRKEMG